MTPESAVSFVTVRRRFDFRSIEVGRWVTPQERDRAAGRFYQALCDFMTILRGPEPLISLRSTLGLQYGIGGRLGVAAHYIPATRQLALAKNAGAGSLAHEWFHAFDHYIGEKLFGEAHRGQFASTLWLGRDDAVRHPLNDRLQACFKAILLDEKGAEPSELFRCSVRADKAAGIQYFSLPEELCAREFEAFVQDANVKNAFLVSGTRESEDAKLGLYPVGAQRERVNRAFHRYYTSLGRALRLAEE